MVATCTAGTTLQAPGTTGYSLCSLKSNYQHLIHQIEIVANGKVINDMQPFISVYKNFKLLSSMSATDQQANINSLGLSNTLDNEKSIKFTTANLSNSGTSNSYSGGSATAAGYQGVGLCNNLPFGLTATAVGPVGTQNVNQSNKAIYDRCSKVIDITGNAANAGVFGTNVTGTTTVAPQVVLMNSTNIQNEFKAYYTVQGNVMTWYDVGLIPLKYLCDCIDKMGLVKKMDLVMRFYVNTGAIQIAVQNTTAVSTTLAYGSFTSNFSTTCPLNINWIPSTAGVPNTTTYITAGLFVAKAPTTIGSNAVTISVSSHQMSACRCYYSN